MTQRTRRMANHQITGACFSPIYKISVKEARSTSTVPNVLPRKNEKSSMPRDCTCAAGLVGRAMTRRTIVIHDVAIPRREANRAPGANPRDRFGFPLSLFLSGRVHQKLAE